MNDQNSRGFFVVIAFFMVSLVLGLLVIGGRTLYTNHQLYMVLTMISSDAPTLTPAPAFTPTATPTSASVPTRCADTPNWDDPLDGCQKLVSPFFQRGFYPVDKGGQQIFVPASYTLYEQTNPYLLTRCQENCASLSLALQPNQQLAQTLYGQRLSGIVRDQCYLAKLTLSGRVLGRDSYGDFPADNLYATFVNGSRQVLSAVTTNARPNPADANYTSFLSEHIWTLRGGNRPDPVVYMGVRLQFGVFSSQSTVRLLSMSVFEAPEAYCVGSSPIVLS
jgi:hypothetical protein